MNTSRRGLVFAALLATLLSAGASTAAAQVDGEAGVSASLSSHEAYVGVPITLQIEIADATTHESPQIPAIDGLRIESLGAPSRSSQTTIINGRRTDRTSATYAWRVTPRREGRFVIPALDVQRDTQIHQTRPLTFVATRSETGDLLFAEVTGARESIYVGQALPVTLKVWIKPFHDAQRDVKLSEADMWQFVSDDPTALGVFGEQLTQMTSRRERPAGREVLRQDSSGNEHSYYLYEIESTFYPKRPGTIDVGDVQVVVSYPTGLGSSRGLFSMFERRLAVTGTRPIVAEASVPAIEVRPIPQVGRPADYRGAVGRYNIVTHASPAHVKAGDPITLQIGIHGDGPLELVQAPPLGELSRLTESFRVPHESLAGIVENGIKVFTTSIRPLRAGITEIPPIPLSCFDPDPGEFVTVYSQPIAITVDVSDTLELASSVGIRPTVDDSRSAAGMAPAFENASEASILRSRSSLPVWPLLILVLAGPLVLAAAWLVRRCWWSDAGWMGPPLIRPLARARRAIARAKTPQELAAAVLQFIAVQLHTGAASLTRLEAIRGLRQRGYVLGVDEVDDLLMRCERMAYAPVASTQIDRLHAASLRSLNELSAQRSFVSPQSFT